MRNVRTPRRWVWKAGVVTAALTVLAGALTGGSAAQATPGTADPHAPSYQHPYRHGAVPTRTAQAKMNAFSGGGGLAGVWYDNTSVDANTNGHQIAVEAVNAAGHFGNTTAAANRNAQYVIFSPKGAHPDGFPSTGFCAWHDWNGDTRLPGGGAAASAYGDIAFTNLPYVLDAGHDCGQNYVNSGSPGDVDGF